MEQQRAAAETSCPAACLAVSGIRRLEAATTSWMGIGVNGASGFVRACVRAAEVRAAISGEEGAARLRNLVSRHPAIAILNFRRHDNGKPMLPLPQANKLRSAAIRPSRTVRNAAQRFLRLQISPSAANQGYSLVHLRSNHVAHSMFDRRRRELGGGAGGFGAA